MGTLDLDRFRRKLHGFELALEQGVFTREWGRPEFEVLVLTSTDERLEHLWQAAREVVPGERWCWYSFATTAALDPAAFIGHPWRTLEDGRVPVLLDLALAAGQPPDRPAGGETPVPGDGPTSNDRWEAGPASLSAPGPTHGGSSDHRPAGLFKQWTTH